MRHLKINWGTGIVLAFIGFIVFILSFVIRMNTQKKYDHQLVTEAYYARELSFQEDMDREQRTHRQGMDPRIERTKKGINIDFPDHLKPGGISGSVSLYRPSDSKEDFEISVKLSGRRLIIPDEKLLPGRWNVEIDWQYGENRYLTREKIIY